VGFNGADDEGEPEIRHCCMGGACLFHGVEPEKRIGDKALRVEMDFALQVWSG